jgi:HEPN domain-containing protein
VSPKAKPQLAREHLDRALSAILADDYTEAVTWLLASLEAAIVGIAEQQGIEAPKHHWIKVKVARELFRDGHLPLDIAELLDQLNAARKEAVYEGEEPDLGEHSLEDIASETEAIVEISEAAR